jgi:hypothetical protein
MGRKEKDVIVCEAFKENFIGKGHGKYLSIFAGQR